jgi:dienelactone hydrolase
MLKHSFTSVLLLLTLTTHAQPMQRYQADVFPDITIEKDRSYNPSSQEYEQAYLFDLYQPKDDTATSRPLIIWLHGGGFKYGSKSGIDGRFWAKNFSRKGYVCAAVNYRLSKYNPVSHFDELMTSCFYAVQDARIAVAYFRKNAAKYHIDPNKIILAGNSAGGVAALQAVYSTNQELGELANIPETNIKAGTPYQPVAAVVSYWGAMFNTDWLKNNNVPIVCVHGTRDRIVKATGNALFNGSIPIHQAADKLHIPNTLKLYDGYGHELHRHFNPFFAGAATRKRWNTAAQFTADYLYHIVAEQ